jgi:hypothetical protein
MSNYVSLSLMSNECNDIILICVPIARNIIIIVICIFMNCDNV